MTFRILSLDGGGPWAFIQARALSAIYPGRTGHEILNEFDLAVANSGGSITLAGLIKNLPIDEIANLFLDESVRLSIFVDKGLIGTEIAQLLGIGSQYSTAAKLVGLTAVMDTPDGIGPISAIAFDQIPGLITIRQNIRFIMFGFDYDRNRETFFRSTPSLAASGAAPFIPPLVGAVNASTNAPVNYFDAPAEVTNSKNPADTRRFWDGAIGGYNNPVLAGVIEALTLTDRSNIVALTLGTASVWLPKGPPQNAEPAAYFQTITDPGLINDIKKLGTAILDDPPDAASLDAHAILTAGALTFAVPVIRMSPMISPMLNNTGTWVLPSGFGLSDPSAHENDNFTRLCNMPMDAIKQDDLEFIDQFCGQWIDGNIINQAVRMNSDTGACEIGYNTFEAAKQAWWRLTGLAV